MSPQAIAHYRIIAKLGEGGMGEVYRATDTRLGRDVAIKILPDAFAQDAVRMARFEREAQVLAALNHPNIAAIYGVEERAIVMELVEGETLTGPLPIETALAYARQIAEALEVAHEKGIIHRDLKPANVKVRPDGMVKVLDFGLAKLSEDPSAADDGSNSPTVTMSPTRAGWILGTAAYMAPEQARGKPVDRRADIWAFGVVLYEMLTGRQMFGGETVSDTLAAVLKTDPDWAALPPGTPPSIRKLLRRCLERDRKRRLCDVGDARLELDEALTEPEVAAVPVTGKPDRRWWIAIAVALGLAAGGGWAVARFRQSSSDERVVRLQINPPEGVRFVLPTFGGLAISPDGKTAVFGARANGKDGLWVRPLDGTSALLLSGTEDAISPFWSHDGRSIAFGAGSKLYRIDADGGTPVAVCDGTIRGGSWGSDGYILFGTVTSGLFRVAASGGTPAPLTTLDASRGESSHRWPQLLPSGRFLYWAQGDRPGGNIVYAASLTRPAERVKLLATDSNVVYARNAEGKGYLFWLRDGTLVAQEFEPDTLKFAGRAHPIAEPVSASLTGQMSVAASANGFLLYGAFATEKRQFTWFDRTGTPLRLVGEPVEQNYGFRLSPDGRRIVVQRSTVGISDFWLLEADRGLANRFTTGSAFHMAPVWSPDSRTILFTRRGSDSLFRKDANGVGDEQLVIRRPGAPLPSDWSGDGRWLLDQEATPDTKYDLWILPMTPEGKLAEGAQPRPYLRTPYNERYARFSPEPSPRWVAYQSDESSHYEVYVDSFPEPRGKKRISTAGGTWPQWGAGGRELFYVSPDNKLMVVKLKPAGDSIEPSAPRELFPLPAVGGGMVSPYDATRDGQQFLVLTSQEKGAQPLTVIVNWPALLRKGTAAP